VGKAVLNLGPTKLVQGYCKLF